MTTEYSPIAYIRLVDFMVYEDETIYFDEGITMIVGLNSAGKSAIRRAMAIVCHNMYVTKQMNFVKHGKERFIIELGFKDGTLIRRVRGKGKLNYYEMIQNDEVVLDTRLNGVSIKLDNEVPVMIARYLGFYQEPMTKISLNLRGSRDRLLLVETTGSENDKTLKDALQITELSEAFRLLNIDRNKIKAEYNTALIELRSKANMCADMSVKCYTEDYVADVESIVRTITEKQELIVDLQNFIDKLQHISTIDVFEELNTIDLSLYDNLLRLASLSQTLMNVSVLEELTVVDTQVYDSLYQLTVLLDRLLTVDVVEELNPVDLRLHTELITLQNKIDTINNVVLYEEVPVLDTSLLQYLYDLVGKSDRLSQVQTEVVTLDDEIKVLQTQLNGVTICKVCGALVGDDDLCVR